jgi:hypothetical protein
MLDVLVWCWFDPLLEGSRQRAHPRGVQLRPDLLMSRRQAARKGVVYQPPPVKEQTPRLLRDMAPRAFKPEHVNRQAALFKKRLTTAHRFVCITDSPEGFSEDVTVIETPPEAREMANWRSPEGNRFPTCYRRLWGQSKNAAKVLSERVLLTDIDAVPVSDMAPLVERAEPFVGWRPFRDWGRKLRIGGGFYLYTPGANAYLWDDFYANPRAAIAAARNAGFRGSDQAWLSFRMAEKVPIYPRTSGIYSIRDLDEHHALPKDARIVQFNGPTKPWDYRGPATWVEQHWRGG